MVAKPQATDWRIEKLVLSSDAGRVNADGWWRAAGRTQQTRLDVSLETQRPARCSSASASTTSCAARRRAIGASLTGPGRHPTTIR
ncbi:MAG: hypothetical protein IPI87_05935 [Betaproteobacteria bacterium]|nr:hypothetical protein [Betaproteobacteria bacterium]